ncbi:MAG: aminoglycoside phosphotransferase family protein [Gammaproteobacteria bacterium]|nr:aminoglycoside phosphotransferase family protein [Gammaproteobacteria bacterium]
MQASPVTPDRPDARLREALAGLLVAPGDASWNPLRGGVSSDIWHVRSGRDEFCVKRALPRLKVAAEWLAPVERNRYEVAWYEIAGAVAPGATPRVRHHDPDAMLFVMDYLDPGSHVLWKDELRDGRADAGFAAEVGRLLATIHAATADDPEVAGRFPPNDIFHAIRLEPYLEATAARHPDLRDVLFGLSERTAATRRAMIHGDVSPKNILVGPGGPVFLDAECACIGDPAFDLAFCLNHLLLKSLWNPAARAGFDAAFEALARAYLAGVRWEPVDRLEGRAASLLPGLLLARVDGKSPVEYLTREADRDRVRRCARGLLFAPPSRLDDVLAAWREARET